MTDDEIEVERWLFEDGAWVPTSYLVPILGSDAGEQLARWASSNDGRRPILRSRAQVFESRRADNKLLRREHNRLHSFFWDAAPIMSNCMAGNFERQMEDVRLVAVGVELNTDDLDRLIGRHHSPVVDEVPGMTVDKVMVRMVPGRKDMDDWARRVGNVARVKITKDYLDENWTHGDENVKPTILEARAALDRIHGKGSRGAPKKIK